MTNHFTSMKIAWDNLLSVHLSMFFAQRLLDGLLNNLAEDDGAQEILRCSRWGVKFSLTVKMILLPGTQD